LRPVGRSIGVCGNRVARATQARDFAKGILFARQHLYASYDLALYTKDAPEPIPEPEPGHPTPH